MPPLSQARPGAHSLRCACQWSKRRPMTCPCKLASMSDKEQPLSARPGWYHIPERPWRIRYWDGRQWSGERDAVPQATRASVVLDQPASDPSQEPSSPGSEEVETGWPHDQHEESKRHAPADIDDLGVLVRSPRGRWASLFSPRRIVLGIVTIGIVAVAVIGNVQTAIEEEKWKVGACIAVNGKSDASYGEGVKVVDCDTPHLGEIVAEVDNENDCPDVTEKVVRAYRDDQVVGQVLCVK